MTLKFPFKDPDEVLDYELDWSARVGTDTIASSTWTVPDGITKNSSFFTDTTTTVWLAGGTEAETYSLLNRIITAGGRTMDQTVKLAIKSK